ncbi:DRTGG domain-containing protein [Dethiosulfatibacter aminovorans DSM 17477]|uniref:DRTGG domain-containing protein n=1 Tax=Dethiosulfatibacter aminovorans DSM 17477 TaxID=1121476 RepID=A0A1M6KK22_9FIRM|nr:DRTGG domain-containing protein [Dethiosulfatibacter aminovorans]SHJ59327.1 DRTGG domain-containing protein [Dethiosulfatibacter aminovorans DSM 17477]
MKVFEIKELLNANVHSCDEQLNKDIVGAYASDLMSDVLASEYLDDNAVLVSGLNNLQLIRTAEMLDLAVIILVRGKQPKPEIIEMARENNITLLTTDYNMYNSCGILYANGVKGFSDGKLD